MSDKDVFAKHVLASIHKDLTFLKEQHYITPQKYNDIFNLLPVIGHPNQGRDVGGYPPSPYTTNSQPSPVATAPPPTYETANALAIAEALYDFRGENPAADLSFNKGDIIQVTEYVNNDWWRGSLHGRSGMFPSNYVQKKTTAPPSTASKHASPPPPPPPSLGMSPPPPPPPSGPGNNSYAYPPPPPASGSGPYAYPPPPAPSGYNSYPPPPPANYGAAAPPPPPAQPVPTYAPPPPAQAPPAAAAPPAGEQQHESKIAGFGKQLAGNVVNAATWGFGGTLGSEAAHAIF
ncbi:hypothetical protein EC973_004215 [Apophysomyces ossiformis]|uniref:SH3 domain-containing protein n=1 Tax=Apophysomyces ossiformis TaxID=679940 RepID=A0A8H7BSK2_9FUNG|nr:hypothetical protein EC973_004215 [Apophysomyces ossiformis]